MDVGGGEIIHDVHSQVNSTVFVSATSAGSVGLYSVSMTAVSVMIYFIFCKNKALLSGSGYFTQ
jgi:hypothetical protein